MGINIEDDYLLSLNIFNDREFTGHHDLRVYDTNTAESLVNQST